MKKKIFRMFAAAALLLGSAGMFSSCQGLVDAVFGVEDKPAQQQPATTPTVDIAAMEQELVGLWWEEYEYAGETEDGEPFNRVLLAMSFDEDHNGCIYLGVFVDNTEGEPLAIYGGYEDSGFAWKLLEDGTLQLSDPYTGETYALTRAAGDSYGKNMTDVSSTKPVFTNGSVGVTNGGNSVTLEKASETKAQEIEQKLSTTIKSNVSIKSGGKAPANFSEDDIR